LSERVNKTIVVKMAETIEIGKSRPQLPTESVYAANELDAATGNLDVTSNLRSA
jgi:hypothetical protein